MDSQTRSFLDLSGLTAVNVYLTDARPAWIWANDGGTLRWANAAGAQFFNLNSLEALAGFSGDHSPARPHIARIAQTGAEDRESTDRLRFYRGLRVMLLTCNCRRLTLPDGSAAALIVAVDGPTANDPLKELCAFLTTGDQIALPLTASDELMETGNQLPTLSPHAISTLRQSSKRSPAFGLLSNDDETTPPIPAGLLALDDERHLLVMKRTPSPAGNEPAQGVSGAQDESDAQSPLPAAPHSETAIEDETPEFDAPAPAIASVTVAPPSSSEAQEQITAAPLVPRAAFTFAPKSRPVRFVWKMDVDRRFTYLSPEFVEAMGPETSNVLGRSWDEVARWLHMDEDGRIARALSRRDTWSGRTLDWPVSGEALRVPVDMAALPAFDRNRIFEGFRGFGVCRVAEAVPDPEATGVKAFAEANPQHAAGADAAALEADTLEPADALAEAEQPTPLPTSEIVPEPAPETSSAAAPDSRYVSSLEENAEAAPPAEPSQSAPSPDEAGDEASHDDETLHEPNTAAEVKTLLPAENDAETPERPEAAPAPSDPPAESQKDDDSELQLAAQDPTPGETDGMVIDSDANVDASFDDCVDEEKKDESVLLSLTDQETSAVYADDAEATRDDAPPRESAQERENVPDAAVETPPKASQPEDQPSASATLKSADDQPALQITAKVEDVDMSRLSKPEREAFKKIGETLGTQTPSSSARNEESQAAKNENVAAPTADAPVNETRESSNPPQKNNSDHEADNNAPAFVDFEKIRDTLKSTFPAQGETSLRSKDGEEDEASDPAQNANSDQVVLFSKAPRPLPPSPRASKLDAGNDDEFFDEDVIDEHKHDEHPVIDPRLLDRLPIGVAIVRDRDVVYANDTLLDLLGYSSLKELAEAGGLEAVFVEPEEWPASSPANAELERTLRVRLASGGLKPVSAKMHAVPWRGARALMMSLMDRRDPSRENALDRLHEIQSNLTIAEERVAEMDAILETATDGVLMLDQSGTIITANRSAEALFNASGDDMIGAPFTRYLAPESRRSALDYLDGLSRNGVASVLNDGREVIGQLMSGGLIPLFMTIGRIGGDNRDAKFCAVLRDITQWKTAEEALTAAKRQAENASSQKSDFLAKISHEIRTPLNAIIGFSEVMMEERFGPVNNDKYKEYLRDIHNSGSHVMSLINDLLDLSKIEAGKLDLSFEAVPFNEVIRECVALMQPQANRERVIIRASLPESVPAVVADNRSLRQVVLNLLSNAIKFNQPGGQVIVSTALEDNGEVIARVRDTGVGMSQKDLEAALEPFRQLHTARHGGGTGLGLPLTKALVEANRASFKIVSELHHGTMIEIRFPPQRVLAE